MSSNPRSSVVLAALLHFVAKRLLVFLFGLLALWTTYGVVFLL